MKYIKSWSIFESDGFSWDERDRMADLGLNPEPTEQENRQYTSLVKYESPESKDIMRARNLAISRGVRSEDGTPYASEAEKMAKLITDVAKLVRRAKAVWRVYNGPGFDPFYRALRRYGFTEAQISELKERAGR
jgi:hypothetical protein